MMMKQLLKAIIFLTVMAILVGVPAFFSTSAQTLPDATTEIGNVVSISTTPNYPGPNESVTVAIQSYSFDLNGATINWYKNGTLISSGQDRTQVSVKSGQLGEKITVKAVITVPGSGVYTETAVIQPESVDILWQANTYTPPFYKGKALYSYQSTVTYDAEAQMYDNGKKLSPASLVYTWSKNGTVLGSLSGLGKQTLSLTGSVISRPETISVTVANIGGTAVAHNSITLQAGAPLTLIYEDNAALGILFNKVLKGVLSLTSPEINLAAIPYFFSTSARSQILYTWQMNGSTIGIGANTTLRIPEGQRGTANVSLEARQPAVILQNAQTGLSLSF